MFSHVPEQHMIGGLRNFHQICSPIRFVKDNSNIIDEVKKKKNAAFSDKRKRMWVHKCFRSRKSERGCWTVYKKLADDEMKFYKYFRMSNHHFSYLLQKIEEGGYYLPRRASDGGIFAHSKLGKYLETHLGFPDDEQLPGTS
jgi:hypothetical protein